tara:strand:+ start:10460 stop:11422 length:963 start_codon:yes stop_codon:yes gene_type:complete
VFSKHDDIFFLGRRPGDKIISDEIRTLFWSTFLDAREFAYEQSNTKSLLAPYLRLAEDAEKQAIGLSLEQLLHPHIGRIELGERAKRLYDFMGANTKIIIVIREQEAWIKSYYSNLVSEIGVTVTFEEFKNYFFAEKDISPLSTLYYDRVYDVYSELFGYDNVKVVPMESIKNSVSEFSNEILRFIGVSPLNNLNTEKRNESASEEHFSAQFYLNNQEGYRLGRSTSIHRAFGWQARSIYSDDSGFELPQPYQNDQALYLKSWRIENLLKDKPEIRKKLQPINRDFSECEKERIRKVYIHSNRRLQELSGIELSQYGYVL